MLEEVDSAMSAAGCIECGCVVTRSLRLVWPQDGLGSGQETNRRADCVRNSMSGFGEVGSGWKVTRGMPLIRTCPWVCPLLGMRRGGRWAVDTEEGG